MLNVKIHWDTVGDEIKRAIRRNRAKKVYAWNVKQAEKYLKYCNTTKDLALIQYANRKLEEAKNSTR